MAQNSSDITLPAEILDTVIDELGCSQDSDPESLNTLLSCALVCRSFHHRAAGHLFANVVITNRRNDYYNYNRSAMERLEDLLQILRENDSIGPRILSFSLDTNLSNPHPDDLETNPANSIRYGQTLSNVLRLLCSIRRFSWRNHFSDVFRKDLGLDLADAITSLGDGNIQVTHHVGVPSCPKACHITRFVFFVDNDFWSTLSTIPSHLRFILDSESRHVIHYNQPRRQSSRYG